jgi:hypothetical protein
MSYFNLAYTFLSSFEEAYNYFFTCIFLNSSLDFTDRNLDSDGVHVHHRFIA